MVNRTKIINIDPNMADGLKLEAAQRFSCIYLSKKLGGGSEPINSRKHSPDHFYDVCDFPGHVSKVSDNFLEVWGSGWVQIQTYNIWNPSPKPVWELQTQGTSRIC